MPNLKLRKIHLALLGLSTATAAPLPAAAQAQPSATLEEVVVTAQRREENLQETPLSITALSSSTLEDIRATDIYGIADFTPNLHITPTIGGSVNAAINIRGAVNANNNLSRDNAVGLYLNGVPIAKTSGAIFDAVDIERMEILRGPQGTLYGKNTIGGAINLITRKPSGELDGNLTVGVGNEGLFESRGSIDLPSFGTVGEGLGKLSARASGFYRKRDGFFDNDGPSSDDFDDRDQWGGRIDLQLEVTDNLTIEYGFDKFYLEQNPTMLAITESERSASFPFYPVIAAATSTDRPDSIANDSAIASDVKIDGHALTITYDMPGTALGDLTLRSITAYRELYTLSLSDFDGTDLDIFRFKLENDFEQTTQELQLLGKTESVDWVVGLFYYEDEWETDNPRWIFQFGGDAFDTSQRGAEDDSYAAYGQFTWTPKAFEQRMDITLGGRYTEETKDVHSLWQDISKYAVDPADPNAGVFVRDAAGNPVFDANGALMPMNAKDTWSEFTYMGAIGWHFSDNVHGYAKLSTGFKSGGFYGVATNNESFTRGFDPETMTAYEIGLKSRLMEDRLQVNVAAFYNDYEDFQAGLFLEEVVGTVVVNAGEAEMSGVELEVTARPTRNLDLVLNYAWLDTDYKKFVDGDGNDISNERFFAYSPDNTVFASAKYTFDPFSFGTLSARVDYAWKDDMYIGIVDDPTTNIESYGLWNARLELADISVGESTMRVAAWGRNLSDEEYWNTAINMGIMTVNQWADPRTYGIELAVDF
jgi:iron complex outermembrane receptor protein